MNLLDSNFAINALRATGDVLAARGRVEPIELVVAGGTAGLLGDLLSPSRTTGDCDVMWRGDLPTWGQVAQAAAAVAAQLDLPTTWLNRDCVTYAWTLLLGWRQRCEPVGVFGPLTVLRLSRIDLIATKVVGAPTRPQDVEDLIQIKPTTDELRVIAEHIDRLEAEDLDRRSFDDQRAILRALGGDA